jgi:hypothetical protein
VSAFSSITASSGITYTSDYLAASNTALSLASGSYLSSPGSVSPSTLPSGGNVAWSASAWVKCASTLTTWASVLNLGGPQVDYSTSMSSSNAITLDVVSSKLIRNSGRVTTLAGSFSSVTDVAFDPSTGSIFYLGNNAVGVISSSGVATHIASVSGHSLALSPLSDYIIVPDTYSHRIRRVSYPGGVVSTLAGSGTAAFTDSTGTSASFSSPYGVAIVPSTGAVIIGDGGNHRIRIITNPDGEVTTLAGSGTAARVDGTGALASFNNPTGISMFPSGDRFAVVEFGSGSVRIVTLAGVVTTLIAGAFDSPRNCVVFCRRRASVRHCRASKRPAC